MTQWWKICLPIQEMQETWVQSLGLGRSSGVAKATHSNILAWEILWTEETGRLYSPWDHKEMDMTEYMCTHMHTHKIILGLLNLFIHVYWNICYCHLHKYYIMNTIHVFKNTSLWPFCRNVGHLSGHMIQDRFLCSLGLKEKMIELTSNTTVIWH